MENQSRPLVVLTGKGSTVTLPFNADVRATSGVETIRVASGVETGFEIAPGDRVAFDGPAAAFLFARDGRQRRITGPDGTDVQLDVSTSISPRSQARWS